MQLVVKGMHCKSCSTLIEEELEDLGCGDIRIALDEATETGMITLETEKSFEEVKAAIEDLGDYAVTRG